MPYHHEQKNKYPHIVYFTKLNPYRDISINQWLSENLGPYNKNWTSQQVVLYNGEKVTWSKIHKLNLYNKIKQGKQYSFLTKNDAMNFRLNWDCNV